MASSLATLVRTGTLTAATTAAVMFCATPADACTTFYVDHDGPTMGKSYDWDFSRGLVYVNKRGWTKRSLEMLPGDVPIEWTSQYASITTNQYGYGMANGGVNEAGLAIDIMVLNDTVYPAPDSRPSLNEAQWVQWALDNFGSVAEFAAAADTVRISALLAGFHYLACDSSGECAAFEYLDGQLVITHSATMPAKTLTNSTYAESAAFLAQHEGFGGTDPIPTGYTSLERFVRASSVAAQAPTLPVPDSVYVVIDSVHRDSGSPWHPVYRMGEGALYWRTYTSPSIKYVNLSSFNGDCYSGNQVLNIDDAGSGDVSASFMPYDTAMNDDLLDAVAEHHRGDFPPGVVDVLVANLKSVAASETCTIEPGTGGAGGNAAGDDDDSEDDGGCSTASGGGIPPAWLLLALATVSLGAARRTRRRRPSR